MNTTELEKIAALPLVQNAIRQQAEAAEAESLAARIAALDAFEESAHELAALDVKSAELEAKRIELECQRTELARQRTATHAATQHAEARHRTHARELLQKHGGEAIASIRRMLDARLANLRDEIALLESLRDRKRNWLGDVFEVPAPAAQQKAAEKTRELEAVSKAREAIAALEFAPVSPEQIERDIRAHLQAVGLSLSLRVGEVQETRWRIEGWAPARKTRTM
jgi:hypothetical protein